MRLKRYAMLATVGLAMIGLLERAVADQPDATHTAPVSDASVSPLPQAGSVHPHSVPPPRPLPLTAKQAEALEQLAMQPEYQIAPDTRAAFSPETQKKFTEASAPAFYGTYFGGLIILLIAAAPL